jgi:hypothetical protein
MEVTITNNKGDNMTLQEAVLSGKTFRRTAVGGSYLSYEDFMEEYGLEREDVLATDYELAPDVSMSFTEAAFAEAWNSARAGFGNIKPAGESAFYHKLLAALRG